MSKVEVDQVDPQSGTNLTLGTSGDSIIIPSGVTLANSGTVTGIPASAISSGTLADARIPDLNASKITAGTIATARLGSGTASSSTFLRGDQTYAEAGGGKINQAVLADQIIQFNTTSSGYVDTGIKVTITPSATSSKVAVWFNGQFNKRTGAGNFMATLYRGSQQVVGGRGLIQSNGQASNSFLIPSGFCYLDSPNTTSATEYRLYLKIESGGEQVWCAYDPNSHSQFMAFEVLA